MTRAQAKERNRSALLDSALQVVSRDEYTAGLDEIAERANLTTGAVYSLFGSKNGLMVALITEHLRPYDEEIEQAAPAGADLLEAVDAFARYYRRSCDAPEALSRLSLQITFLGRALHDPELGGRLAASVRSQENQLTALFTGRPHGQGTVTSQQSHRLTTALNALFVGLSQGVLLGLAPGADEDYFADAARALAAGMVVAEPDPASR
ncbi:TetR/AcrR family transcriptional regulator [Streptomyces sp. DH8]|uniref:TetR/AcrR family transcriptional regulator n=1 Tax=Streptomyces sp. DH8 TaxID=2857008 RepID=UPI001E512C61|nr:TetR/AcrR family transcriptional regulator [Streptomyces sp. DH8]